MRHSYDTSTFYIHIQLNDGACDLHEKDPRFNTNQLNLRREGDSTESGPEMTRISVKDSFPHYFHNKILEHLECVVVLLLFLEVGEMEEILYDI